MANPYRSGVLAIGPDGSLFDINGVHGFRELPDGRVIFTGVDNTPLAIIDPDGYDGVDRQEAIKALRRLVLDAHSGKPVILPDWMKAVIA